MHYLVLFILLGCSSQVPLRYKYASYGRNLSSLEESHSVVSRIEGNLKDPILFASGIDSTYLVVKLFDHKDHLLTDVDPGELTLSTSEDIKAKPFVLKQGVYKTEILPRVKSKNIQMRVDWKGRVLSSEILLQTTMAPLKNELLPVNHEYFQTKSVGEINVIRGSHSLESFTDGFSLENIGDNKIVDGSFHKSSQRVFHFDYLEQARQNLSMQVDDYPNENLSQVMHSIFMFFPRKNIPMVEQLTGTINVTLPNGEKMIYRKSTKEIVGGVFTEGPVDISSEKFKRQFAHLKYQGKGVVLRVNARGQSPQLSQYEDVKIDMEYGLKGSMDVLIINGQTRQKCRRPKSDFWETMDVSPIEFKFPTDDEFNAYLKKNCGFSLPKL
jgi:hypothetical protein